MKALTSESEIVKIAERLESTVGINWDKFKECLREEANELNKQAILNGGDFLRGQVKYTWRIQEIFDKADKRHKSQ